MAQPDRITRFFDRIAARSPRWLAPVAVLGCLAGAVGYTVWADPTRSAPDAAPTCLLKLTTGLDCPGCGGTRAFWYLLHGDLPAAARHHIVFVFAVPFLLYLYVAWAGKQLFGWRLPQLTAWTDHDRCLPRCLDGLLGAAQPALGAVHLVLRLTPVVPRENGATPRPDLA